MESPADSGLLAVDLGLKTGLAYFGRDGLLKWYRSQNFGTATRLKRGIVLLLKTYPDVAFIVMEGGGPLAETWRREAGKAGIAVLQIHAEVWRKDLLLSREQRTGGLAKRNAGILARKVITWSGAARPTSLRHDTAEAILVGLWGVKRVGWLDKTPCWDAE